MTIIQTIKLVLKNGYKHQVFNLETMIKDDMLDPDTVNSILLNRNFWIVLGKGMGWPEITETYGWYKGNHDANTERMLEHFAFTYKTLTWQFQWRKFIDHLASGGTPEKWFESLEELKK